MVGYVLLWVGCGNYPEPLATLSDLKRASPKIEMVQIADLPLNAYPELKKFRRLRTVVFYKLGGAGADDEKLRSLARIGLEGIEGIDLQNSQQVTDKGIEWLTQLRSLKWLQLEGTSVSDRSLELASSRMALSGLNVARTKVTLDGLKALGSAKALRELTFSTEGEASKEICQLLQNCQHIKHVEILDLSKELNGEAVKECAANLGIQLLIR